MKLEQIASECNGMLVEECRGSYTTSDEDRYSFNHSLLRIVDLTIHTVRQAWILLSKTLPYDFSNYIKDGNEYPNFDIMKKYVDFSSLAYLSTYSIGTLLCEVTSPEHPTKDTTLHLQKSNKQKTKSDPFCVVVVAIAVLPNHTGIKTSSKLLEYTINKVKEAKLSKLYSIVDERLEGTETFYRHFGFVKSDRTFESVIGNLNVVGNGRDKPLFSIMELSISNEK